jgi:hypothetical protein
VLTKQGTRPPRVQGLVHLTAKEREDGSEDGSADSCIRRTLEQVREQEQGDGASNRYSLLAARAEAAANRYVSTI